MIITFENGVWSKFSPGKLLILRLLSALKADGYTMFDLGFGDEPWKSGICDRTTRPLHGKTERDLPLRQAAPVEMEALAQVRLGHLCRTFRQPYGKCRAFAQL